MRCEGSTARPGCLGQLSGFSRRPKYAVRRRLALTSHTWHRIFMQLFSAKPCLTTVRRVSWWFCAGFTTRCRGWHRLLSPSACFCFTTCSEHARLPPLPFHRVPVVSRDAFDLGRVSTACSRGSGQVPVRCLRLWPSPLPVTEDAQSSNSEEMAIRQRSSSRQRRERE